MRTAWMLLVLLLGIFSAPRETQAAVTVQGDRFQADLPDGFRPTTGATARAAAASLRELLSRLGVEAIGARRVRYDVVGAPADPEAAFLARCFAVRPPEADVLGRISDAELLAGWARYTADHKDHTPSAPRHRTVSGFPSHEVGGSEPAADGMVRWTRVLLVFRPGEVLMLSLTATTHDARTWQATWDTLVDGLRVDSVKPQHAWLQGIAAGTAIGALAMAVLLKLLSRYRARRARAQAKADAPASGPARVPLSAAARTGRPAGTPPSAPAREAKVKAAAPVGGSGILDLHTRQPGATALETSLSRRLGAKP